MIEIRSLEELKSIELEIMKKVHIFCEENSIRYVLTYGSLLGAVRHNGFIPWDDDIDIHMTREEYEKFERDFPKWGKAHGLKIINNHTKGNELPRDMIKVCDDRTLLIERSFKNQCRLGVFIDIWPLDKAPIKLSILDKIWIKRVGLVKRITQASDLRKDTETYRNYNMSKKLFVLIFGHADPVLNTRRQELLSKKKKDIKEAQYIPFQARHRFFQESDLFPAKLFKFEDTEFYVPQNYDSVLKNIYGDYMKLPPKEKQKPHHVQDVYWI